MAGQANTGAVTPKHTSLTQLDFALGSINLSTFSLDWLLSTKFFSPVPIHEQMNMASPKSSGPDHARPPRAPKLTSLQDLTLIEAWDTEKNAPKYVTFYHVTADEELWFGQSPKNKRDLTLDEYREALERVPDEDVYPEIPPGARLTLAPDSIPDPVHVKRPGLNSYEAMKGTHYVVKNVLDEALAMEKVSKGPAPRHRQVPRLPHQTPPHHLPRPGAARAHALPVLPQARPPAR